MIPCLRPLLLGAALAGGAFTLSVASAAAAPTKAQLDFFEAKVRPVLVQKCYKCHAADSEKLKGGLHVDTRDGLLKGGNTGPAVVPGDPDKSLLIQAVRYTDPDLQMPPKGEKLTAQQVADLTQWVKQGAPDPRTPQVLAAGSTARKGAGKDHWAFQPVKEPAVPTVSDPAWQANPVDAFVFAKLAGKGLKPSGPAEKSTLIRRAYYDLIGLPPKAEEVEDFLLDKSPDAFAKVVDRLLQSAHYGERWGRHWLDSARYSDTKGEIKKNYEDEDFGIAWTYRDYVIRAFNEDKPYNQFVMEQIAADRLPQGQAGDRSALAALGFLTLGERFMNNQNDIIDDRIDVVTKGFLGLTAACARCHDHKFDPIPTADYYSLHGIFASSLEPRDKPVIGRPADPKAFQDFQMRMEPLKKELAAIEAQVGSRKKGQAPDPTAPKRKPPVQLSKAQKKAMQKRVSTLEDQMATLQMTHPGAPLQAMALVDSPRPTDSPIFIRGEAQSKGAIAPRRFLEVLSSGERQPFRDGSGRLELARAIADKNNPLTARVMVNRIWQGHFGEGFVTTPDDFGTMADPPSHPELLDYLATQFMARGWSVKSMHRQILLSRTYQQSSETNPRYAQVDPANRLLWRANVRRLDFESTRDTVLAVGGSLDERLYGPPVRLDREPYPTRRTVYGYVDRNDLVEVMNHFDFANPDMTMGKRDSTTVPQQALFFMNSPMVVEQAKKLVSLTEFTRLSTDEAKIDFLFRRLYQRPANPVDIQLSQRFLKTPVAAPKAAVASAPERPPVVARKGKPAKTSKKDQGSAAPAFVQRAPLTDWEEFAHAMMMANEFSYVN
jgi:hypothetical protein